MEKLNEAIEILKSGGVVGMPTETVYGLAASIENENAIQRIFRLKKRPFFDPLIVHLSDLSQVEGVAKDVPSVAYELMENFWPGPLTLVLPKKETVSGLITSGLDTVALRVPKHDLALKLIEELGQPLAAPSANMFGRTSPTQASHVRESFPDVLVLDGGTCEVGLESTVVQVINQEIQILRPGAVTAEMLKEVAPSYHIVRKTKSVAPGHLEHHYQPQKKLILIKDLTKNNGSLENAVELRLSPDPALAARELYSKMRDLDKGNRDFIYCRWENEWKGQLWEAIWDRLKKAATTVF